MQTLVSGGRVFRDGKVASEDILIEDGRITSFPESGSVSCSNVINVNNGVIFPGFTDVHVHFREPGFSYKEDMATGSAAAANGGYTTVCTMPNLDPVPDSMEHLCEQLDAIDEKARIHVYPYASITVGEKGEELSDMEAMAPYVVGFSDDGRGVQTEEMMVRAMTLAKSLGKPIVAHCEDNSLLGGRHVNAGPVAKLIGIEGITGESEWRQIERDLKLAAKIGCSYHVCHISTAKSVEIIRKAKKAGVDVTCETAPHYLLLDEEDIVNYLRNTGRGEDAAKPYDRLDLTASAIPGAIAKKFEQTVGFRDAAWKMNPPLRSRADREALLEGLADGTIDCIATDHAPHSAEEKMKGLLGAPMGITGIEAAFPMLFTELVKKEIIPLEKLIDLICINPSKRFGIGLPRGLKVGENADLTCFDLTTEYRLNAADFRSKGQCTPFDGRMVYGKCLWTMASGLF